jgi:hypothetical protein
MHFFFTNSNRKKTSLLLDGGLSGLTATAAYSLRKLSKKASLAVRVRRSDMAELDIGFVGNNLDTASLLSFVGVGDGFVVTWYNQVAPGTLDATNSTAASQPRIVASGVLQIRNNRPVIEWPNAAQDGMRLLITGFGTGDRRAVHAAHWPRTGLGLNSRLITDARVGATSTVWAANSTDGVLYTNIQQDGLTPTAIGGAPFPTYDAMHVAMIYQAAATSPGSSTIGNTVTSPTRSWYGSIGEIIIWPAIPNTEQALKINRDMGAYFGVTIP